eukprot:6658051-Pyramimonas_sp.AAC.2
MCHVSITSQYAFHCAPHVLTAHALGSARELRSAASRLIDTSAIEDQSDTGSAGILSRRTNKTQ